MQPDPLAVGRSFLERQPFSALLGATLEVFAPGEAQIVLPVKPELLQQHGFVHGGVLAYLADNALTFAAGTVLGDAVTVEVKINYTRPAKDCTRLRAVARVLDAGSRQSVCRCDVFAETDGAEPVLCAAAQGTIRKVG